MREAAESTDNIRMDFGMAETLGIGTVAKESDATFLVGEVLRVHERQVKELPFLNRKLSIDPLAERPVGNGAGLRVGGISASLAAEQIARELVEKDEKSERAVRGLLPVIQRSKGRGLVGRRKSRADLTVEDVIGLEPFVGTRPSPEGKYLVWCRNHVLDKSLKELNLLSPPNVELGQLDIPAVRCLS